MTDFFPVSQAVVTVNHTLTLEYEDRPVVVFHV
jgi:hypothetical protein